MNYQIRIRILTLDLNDIHAGVNCLDSLKFYKSSQPKREDRLVCKLNNFNRVVCVCVCVFRIRLNVDN